MSEQEAIEILRAYYEPNNRKQNEAMDMAIKALGTDGDLIDRQAAIDAADRADYTGLAVEDVKLVTDEVVKEIKKLPSAQPEDINADACASCPAYKAFFNEEDLSDIEILSILRSLYNCFDEYEEPVYHALSEAIKALSAQPESSFVTWLLDEIWDEDMWELNWQAFPEVLCRKLTKLGYIKEKDGEYERLDQQTGCD